MRMAVSLPACQPARIYTHPHFANRLAAIVAYLDGHIDVLAVRVPALVQAGL